MFMQNRIELAMLDHIQGISALKNGGAGWLQKTRKSSDKIIDVVDMSDDVISDYDICEFTFGRQLIGTSPPEEIVNRRHANGVGLRYRSICRINTEAVNPTVDEVAKQVSIIAGNLNHETEGAKLVLASQLLDMLGRMLQERGRG
jgi:hypothetical protein